MAIMLKITGKTGLAAAALFLMAVITVPAQNIVQEYDDDDYYRWADRPAIDRFLDVEVWTDHADAEYYEGDEVVVYYRASRDAFVAIYSIDTRGRVNLLFPSEPGEDNFVHGGQTYSLPGPGDDYDLVVSGPEGTENIQIIASREKFPIPGWYHNSGLVCDAEDRYEYMDFLNGRHFVRYDGQRFAYDRAVIFINEWEPSYFHPVYYPRYPSWSVCGNVYIDYPWGSTVYINGYYWGCTPLYVPRILVGWHTITIYDPWGYCWEDDFHVGRYHSVIFDKTVIRTRVNVVSRYKEVRLSGYRNPIKHGYPNYEKVVLAKSTRAKDSRIGAALARTPRDKVVSKELADYNAPEKKYVRGNAEVVKTDRGYETRSVIAADKSGKKSRTKAAATSRGLSGSSKSGKSRSSSVGSSADRSGSSGTYRKAGKTGSSGSAKSGKASSSGFYKKKSGKSSTSGSTVKKKSAASSSKKSATYKKAVPKKSGKSGSSTPKVKKTEQKSSSNKASQGKSRSSQSKSSSGKSGSGGKKRP
jgi:hypothetical protein